MSDQSSSTNRKVSTGQVRSLAILWAGLTVVVGVGTFFGLFWALGGFDTADESLNTSDQLSVELATESIDLASIDDKSAEVIEPTATEEATLLPTLVEEPTDIPVTPSPEIVVAEATATTNDNNVPTVVSTDPPTDIPAPTAVPVVASSTGGFSLGGQVIHGGLLALDKMQSMKMSWVKIQYYDLGGATIEGDINNAHNNGLKILASVKDNANHNNITSPAYQEQFIQFLERAARLGVDAIEVWNEPNLDREWPADQMGGANYTELLKKAYPRIKAANPNTMVISAALSPTGAFSGGCGYVGSVYGCDDKPFLQAMVNAGALNYLDCVGMHYNEGLLPPSATSGDPRGSSQHYTRYFRGMLDTYSAVLGGARSICLTEIGYLSGEEWGYLPSAFAWNPPINMTVAQHAEYLGQAVSLARQMGNIRLFIVFNVDFAILKTMEDDPQAGYSVVRPNQNCPACSAIAGAMP
ncbi:MAG TPA: hypothetical protein DCL76_08785 [Chloroflexi bacterium]|nr:hypothetical protein [Chloroflexota bacterium]HCU97865.1 hypothetical protein [Chloroflexota bacterium]|tara:strand:+ start:892 stop:2295 length:1404 start_codon:yes stop_codon:yes gene_type:complete